MKAVIDSKNGDYFKCLLENGDILNIHEDDFEESIEIGDLVDIKISKLQD